MKLGALKVLRFFHLIDKCEYNVKRQIEVIKRTPLFDEKWYLETNPDVKNMKGGAIKHYVVNGWKEGRNPNKEFDGEMYLKNFPQLKEMNVCPLFHFIKNNKKKSFEMSEFAAHLFDVCERKDKFVKKDETGINEKDLTKLIAFYLPQFHLFEENEKWHGKGFTEWTNVTKALPHYVGHYQPQLPIDVGFYDLANVEVMRRQVELAKLYGVHGFCFHYYWFSGKKLMEKPLYNWLKNKDINFPFCLCWANENWSKLWDGGDREVLMKQELKNGDDEKFAKDIICFFKDDRYIRVNGAPLLIVYRASLFSNERFCKFIDKLKSVCKENGIDDVYVCLTNSFSFNENPKKWNANAIVEFPPHMVIAPLVRKKVMFSTSCLNVYDFGHYIREGKHLYKTKFTLFKTVFPGWDNTARKGFSGGSVFEGCTPQIYQKWLEDCIRYTQKEHSDFEQFVFINAWNEWAEGAHLEPDRYYGYAYLDATKKALYNTQKVNLEKEAS